MAPPGGEGLLNSAEGNYQSVPNRKKPSVEKAQHQCQSSIKQSNHRLSINVDPAELKAAIFDQTRCLSSSVFVPNGSIGAAEASFKHLRVSSLSLLPLARPRVTWR